MGNIYRERIEKLRVLMEENDLSAYIIYSGDCHGSEYVGDHFRCVRFISGFDGSAGTVVILKDSAGLWTDGRYFIQAAEQLKGTGIDLFRSGEPGVPKIHEYLCEKLAAGAKVGFDGLTITAEDAAELKEKLDEAGIGIVMDEDLCGRIWDDRPPIAHRKIWSYSTQYTGASCADKLSLIREKMQEKGADCHILSALDTIAYVYNLRGDDIAYNPVFMSYSVIYPDRAYLYCDPDAAGPDVREMLENDNVFIKPYDAFLDDIKALRGTILVDGSALNALMMGVLTDNEKDGVTLLDERDPETLMKAIKNPAEMENIRLAHIKDGAAVTKLIFWLKHHDDIASLTEIDVAEKLVSIRKEMDGYIGESFDPIIATGAHGAIVHYSASEKTNAHLEKDTFLLMDTGGHYINGTTDITRTIATGEVTPEMKRHFTAVLKGHLKLSALVFKDSTGANLDIYAREPLWEMGLDYRHGTGHGVGHLLNVHEGPQSIRIKHLKDDEKFAVGMLTSDEPGVYLEGQYGIRTENLMLCVPYDKTEYGEFLTFEFVTMVPYDRYAIDFDELTAKDMDILEKYYKKVRESISPYLTDDEREWLLEETDISIQQKP